MSYQQVKYYESLGDYQQAYSMARDDWSANSRLKWPRDTIAWLLIRMMKVDAKVYAKNRFIKELKEFIALDIPKTDTKLWGAIVWPIRDIVEDSIRMQWFTSQFGDELFDIIKDLPFHKPSESYSAMLAAFIELGALWPRLGEFIEWWGLENLTPFDYRRYPHRNELVSLADKVLKINTQIHRQA